MRQPSERTESGDGRGPQMTRSPEKRGLGMVEIPAEERLFETLARNETITGYFAQEQGKRYWVVEVDLPHGNRWPRSVRHEMVASPVDLEMREALPTKAGPDVRGGSLEKPFDLREVSRE